jgi:hypothetical protein
MLHTYPTISQARINYSGLQILKYRLDSRMNHLLSVCHLVVTDTELQIFPPCKKVEYFICRRMEYLDRKTENCLGIRPTVISSNGRFYLW